MVTPAGRLSVAGQGPDGCRRLVIDKKPISLVYARAMAVHYYFYYKPCAFYRARVRVASSSSRDRFVAFVRAEDQWTATTTTSQTASSKPAGAYWKARKWDARVNGNATKEVRTNCMFNEHPMSSFRRYGRFRTEVQTSWVFVWSAFCDSQG